MKPIFLMLCLAGVVRAADPALVQVAASPSASVKRVPRFDWKFDALIAADTAVMLWDEHQTVNCLAHITNCRETNPLYGPHPSAARLYGLALAVDAGYIVGSYELRRHGPAPLRKFWSVGVAYVIEQHIQGIATSARSPRRVQWN